MGGLLKNFCRNIATALKLKEVTVLLLLTLSIGLGPQKKAELGFGTIRVQKSNGLIGETVNQPTIMIRTASLTCCTEHSLYLRTSNGTIGIVRLRPTSSARDVLIDNGSGNHNKSFQNYISDNPMAYLTSSINSLPALAYISSLLDNN